MTDAPAGDLNINEDGALNDPDVVDDFDEPLEDLEALSYFGTDYDVHGLVRRLNEADILIPNFDPVESTEMELHGFQRRFVWKKPQMDKFIESLLLGFPVPGIFLVQQTNKQQLVLDGQQRLRTLQAFYSGKLESNEEFALENVERSLRGLTYATLDADMKRVLDNTFIHATVTKFSKRLGGDKSIYSLFERLNTGGTNLYPQEIRVALYSGALVDKIRELNGNASWRELFGPVSQRLKDQELILRFWAFSSDRGQYKRPLKNFLNDFLREHRELQGLDSKAFSREFAETCAILQQAMGRNSFRHTGQINAALADSVFIGLMTRLSKGPIKDVGAVAEAKARLLADEKFVAAIGRATADEDRVAYRLNTAIAVLGDVT